MAARHPRDERIELRTTSEEKVILAEAARRARLDLTAFILGAAVPAARELIDRPETLLLSRGEAAQLLDLLDDTPQPTPALVEAARRRRGRS
ncbi:MAG: DUF1778 domain-containing protein [Dehalococcoidia bacterium]